MSSSSVNSKLDTKVTPKKAKKLTLNDSDKKNAYKQLGSNEKLTDSKQSHNSALARTLKHPDIVRTGKTIELAEITLQRIEEVLKTIPPAVTTSDIQTQLATIKTTLLHAKRAKALAIEVELDTQTIEEEQGYNRPLRMTPDQQEELRDRMWELETLTEAKADRKIREALEIACGVNSAIMEMAQAVLFLQNAINTMVKDPNTNILGFLDDINKCMKKVDEFLKPIQPEIPLVLNLFPYTEEGLHLDFSIPNSGTRDISLQSMSGNNSTAASSSSNSLSASDHKSTSLAYKIDAPPTSAASPAASSLGLFSSNSSLEKEDKSTEKQWNDYPFQTLANQFAIKEKCKKDGAPLVLMDINIPLSHRETVHKLISSIPMDCKLTATGVCFATAKQFLDFSKLLKSLEGDTYIRTFLDNAVKFLLTAKEAKVDIDARQLFTLKPESLIKLTPSGMLGTLPYSYYQYIDFCTQVVLREDLTHTEKQQSAQELTQTLKQCFAAPLNPFVLLPKCIPAVKTPPAAKM